MNNIIKINASEFGLEESKASQIAEQFKPMLDKMIELETEYNQIIILPVDKDTCAKAKALRLKYVKVRTGTAEIHKAQKAFYLAGGRYVDGWKNAQAFASQGIEENLEQIEKHFENIEKERIAALKIERNQLLAEVCDNPEMYAAELMPQEAFDNLVTGLKLAKEQKIEAERKAEEERIERERLEQEERERVRLENERLKKEAEEREAAIAKERAEAEAKLAEERRLNAEREAKEKAEREAIAQKERKEAAEKLAAEQAEKQRLENELKAKQQAEQEAKDKAAADEEARLSMGDKAKFEELISDLEKLKVKHSFKSAKFKKAHADVVSLLDKTINFAISKQ